LAQPTPPQGVPQLDQAIKVLGQLTVFLGGVPAVIALGASLIQMFRNAGRSDEEAQAEVDKFIAAVKGAQDFNAAWLAEHPRQPEDS
jgi:hypothetical protein